MREDSSPFSSELEATGFKDWIKSPRDNPEYIVRDAIQPRPHSGSGELFSPFFPEIPQGATRDEASEVVAPVIVEAKKLLEEVGEYGINVPSVDYVLGYREQDRKPTVFTVVKRVEGTDLGSCKEKEICKLNGELAETITDTQFRQIEELIVNILRYYTDKIQNRQRALVDISRPEQYVLGEEVGREEDEKIYLVDIDPRICDFSSAESTAIKFSNLGWQYLIKFTGTLSEETNVSSDLIEGALSDFYEKVVLPRLDSKDEVDRAIVEHCRSFPVYSFATLRDRRDFSRYDQISGHKELLEYVHLDEKKSSKGEFIDELGFVLDEHYVTKPSLRARAKKMIATWDEFGDIDLAEALALQNDISQNFAERLQFMDKFADKKE